MNTEKKYLPASIHQRLLNKARQSGRAFNELLQYYAIERLLYRLSISEYSELFTLKGALIFNVWGLTNLRPTRDIDLLGHTQNTIDSVVKIFQDLSKLEVEPDGIEFDPLHIHGERIKEDAEYEGIRITMAARLGNTRLAIQIDIGFADVVTPAPERLDYPTILDFPAPHLYGYPPETVIAEKFQAMTVLGMANSRMKDFYDVWTLITHFEFEGRVIQTAIERTFQNRSTELPTEEHIVFSDEFAENKGDQWNAFSRKLQDEDAVMIDQIIATMRDFLFPILDASQQGTVFKKKWKNKWR
ncbi:MAG TPA: nucleotidyl transferase AbiEii/AbiGii toxin family protein [Anaerolineales bacterium]|nr:nucleotidyl transferase AbiEii/AbiGii toxin family protein [Anaerolineales bacterium]